MPLVRAIPVLPVPDLERTVDFYMTALGFERVFMAPGDSAGVERDAVRLHFWLTDDPALPTVSSCRIEVDSRATLAAVHAQAQAAGIVHPNGALGDRPWGAREFTALDPFGNGLIFACWLDQP